MRGFCKDENGGLTVEAILVLPFLIWTFVATYGLFDAYRAQGVTLKAAYTIADTLSRETGAVDSTYIAGLNNVLDQLTFSPQETQIRVTAVTFVDGAGLAPDRHRVMWSNTTSPTQPAIDRNNFASLAADLPDMVNGAQILVVDSWVRYTPPFSIGFEPTLMFNRLITRPRFTPQLAWAGPTNQDLAPVPGPPAIAATILGATGVSLSALAEPTVSTGTADATPNTSPLPAPIILN